MAPEHVEALAARGNTYRRGVPELPHTFERLLDGDRLRMGGTQWRVLEGHGHSPEHASLYSTERSVLISGDMLLPRISTNVSVWPVEPDGDPLGRFLASLDRLAELPSGTLVLPSHGLPFVGIAARVEQLRATTFPALPNSKPRRASLSPPRTSCRCSSAASSTCSSAFSRWARRSPI